MKQAKEKPQQWTASAGAVATKARRGNTVDHLHALLQAEILSGGFAPGQRLIEADLTRDYDVSRGPLREALRKLAVERLVDMVPNKGTIVRRMTYKEVADIMMVRGALEGLAAGLAALKINDGHNRARMEKLMETAKLGQLKPVREFLEENNQLHSMLVAIADNEQLAELISQMGLRMFPHRVSEAASDDAYRLASSKEHALIAKAVLSGSEERARTAMQQHLQNAERRIRALMI